MAGPQIAASDPNSDRLEMIEVLLTLDLSVNQECDYSGLGKYLPRYLQQQNLTPPAFLLAMNGRDSEETRLRLAKALLARGASGDEYIKLHDDVDRRKFRLLRYFNMDVYHLLEYCVCFEAQPSSVYCYNIGRNMFADGISSLLHASGKIALSIKHCLTLDLGLPRVKWVMTNNLR